MSKKLTLGAVLAVVISLALVAAGCGGGGKKGYALTKAEYASALSKICADFNAKQKSIAINSIEDLAAKGDELTSSFQDAIDKAKALQAPDEIKDTAKAFIDNGQKQVDLAKDVVEAAKAKDEAKVNEIGAKGSALDKESKDLANQLGATECAKD